MNFDDKEKNLLKDVKESLSGDANAFEWIVRKYQKRIYFAVLKMVMNHDDANDVLQDTFIKAYTKLDTYDTDYPFYPWLYRIAINTALNHQKKKTRDRLLSLEVSDDNHHEVLTKPPDQMTEMEGDELAVKLKEALGKLPPEQRLVFSLRVQEGFSYQEISDYLEISMGTVMSRLSRAREKLRALLQNYLETKDIEV